MVLGICFVLKPLKSVRLNKLYKRYSEYMPSDLRSNLKRFSTNSLSKSLRAVNLCLLATLLLVKAVAILGASSVLAFDQVNSDVTGKNGCYFNDPDCDKQDVLEWIKENRSRVCYGPHVKWHEGTTADCVVPETVDCAGENCLGGHFDYANSKWVYCIVP